MKKIDWTDNLNLNIEELDIHHRKFLDIVNELLQAIEEKRSNEIQGKVIDELISYAFYHFSKEEKCFKDTNYPQAEEHIKEHERFVDKLTQFRNDFQKHKLTLSIEMIYFMKDWWINHIRISDRGYIPYVNCHNL